MPFAIPVPLKSAYKIAALDPCVRTDMEFGAARMRRRTAARLDTVNVEWLFSPSEMTGFRTWYDSTVAGGSSWFDLNLDVGDGPQTRASRFTGPWSAAREGAYWRVGATLEVR